MKVTRKQYHLILTVWTIIVLVLLLMPSSSFSSANKLVNIPHADKIAHFVLFGMLSVLLFKNLEFVKKKEISNIYFLTIVDIFVFGLFTEILQGLMYNTAKRSFSLVDLAFDVLSSVVTMSILYLLYGRNKQIK